MKLAIAVLTSVIVSLCAATVHADPIQIRFSHTVSGKAPKGQMAKHFKKLVEERLKGRVEVKIYPRSLMYLDSEVVSALQEGKLELAAPALSKLKRLTPKLQVFDLPFLFKDMAAVDRFQNSPQGKALLQATVDQGVLGLGYLHNGMKQMSANDPLRVPEDANGKRFRIMSSEVIKAQFEVLGAEGVKAAFPDVFNMLARGKVNGQENTWSNIYSAHLHRHQKYITESNHGLLDYMVITSAEFWQNLPADIRVELDQIMAEAIAFGNQVAAANNDENRQSVIDFGHSEIVTLSDQQRAAWELAMAPVWQQFANEIGPDLILAAKSYNQ
ncbi:DctP family TRAP transporter solute-binding subunit [Oceanobacter kriegii]|uniref:DctP family TRAP transporter solute-binding subunit n=1 Tax=Oceanobacter kriegii TaxID=64972 RepID=UPI0004042352|nr:DctP family TRAP transporter solute-binding subunit [Oceanobacter kriegii]